MNGQEIVEKLADDEEVVVVKIGHTKFIMAGGSIGQLTDLLINYLIPITTKYKEGVGRYAELTKDKVDISISNERYSWEHNEIEETIDEDNLPF